MKSLKSILLLFSLLWLSGCNSTVDKIDLYGLWELAQVKIDSKDEPLIKSIYLQFNSNATFSAALRTGDLSGIYSVGSKNNISMFSDINQTFSNEWNIDYLDKNMLILRGKAVFGSFHKSKSFNAGDVNDSRNTVLRFIRSERVDDYADFEQKVLGVWEVFMIIQGDEKTKPEDLTLMLNDDGSYVFLQHDKVVESGYTDFNSRYKKIYTGENNVWAINLVGNSLILINENEKTQYRMRRK